MWTPHTLLITDANLGEAAHERLSAVCSDLTWVSWDLGGSPEILSRIAEGRWALGVSFYSDLVLTPAALAAIRLPLNIHPALPHVRGVGHDVVPLVERHPTIGPTMHRMERPIDTGEIVDVLEVPLPPGMTYASLRALNQQLSLRMLDRLCGLLAASADVADLERRLAASAAAVTHRWGGYYSRRQVAALREAHLAELGIDTVAGTL